MKHGRRIHLVRQPVLNKSLKSPGRKSKKKEAEEKARMEAEEKLRAEQKKNPCSIIWLRRRE